MNEEAKKQYEFLRGKVDIYEKGFTHLQTMGEALAKDFHFVVDMKIDEKDEAVKTRGALRTLFSYIEAHIYAMKKLALDCADFDGGFTAEEIAMLKEETCELDDKGIVKTHPKFIPLPRNVRFAFEMSARAMRVNNPLDVSVDSWDSFKKALDLRNRITHPRTTEDLVISDEEFNHITKAAGWFADNFRSLIDGFAEEIKRMEARLTELRTKAKEAPPA